MKISVHTIVIFAAVAASMASASSNHANGDDKVHSLRGLKKKTAQKQDGSEPSQPRKHSEKSAKLADGNKKGGVTRTKDGEGMELPSLRTNATTATVVANGTIVANLTVVEEEIATPTCVGCIAIATELPGYDNHQCDSSIECASTCCAYLQSRVCVGVSDSVDCLP